jgi:DNA-binding transcriptional regulator YhcF (GntR family)
MGMIDMKLDYHSSVPLYQQITEQIRRFIAAEQVKSGEHLPFSAGRHMIYII